MKKIQLTLLADVKDDVDTNEIKRDLEQEISCASHTYEVLNVEEIKETQTNKLMQEGR